jgi:hypothetical protein
MLLGVARAQADRRSPDLPPADRHELAAAAAGAAFTVNTGNLDSYVGESAFRVWAMKFEIAGSLTLRGAGTGNPGPGAARAKARTHMGDQESALSVRSCP